ncbi:hypothetical protein [Mesorhizobium sp. M0207]|uniref:hypothetical protein n=1 Tax=Mesorhizobium sp. M0207 TaxID=2956915 RepID=UPI00333C6141
MKTFAALDRRSFLDWIAEDSEPRGSAIDSDFEVGHMLGAGMVGLIWEGKARGPNNLPSPLLVVADDDIRDFLAWTSTYISNYTPFTAFFRVVTAEDVRRFELLDDRSSALPETMLTALAGVAVAEAVVQMPQSPRTLTSLSVQACQATFSYAALRGLASGLHPADLSELAEAWGRAREITSDISLRLDADSSSMFWMIAVSSLMEDSASTKNRSGTWTEAIEELIRAARFDRPLAGSAAWQQLKVDLPFIGSIEKQFEVSREEQLHTLDRTAQTLIQSSVPRPLAEAWVGMLASRLSNGSFDYIGVLDSVRDALPSSLLWFALFSSWRPGFDGLVNGRCLGRQVAKEALEQSSIFDVPTADISLREFEIAGRSRSQDSIRTKVSSIVEVELLPMISSKFRFSRTREDTSRERLPELNIPRLRNALMEALQSLEQPEPSRDFRPPQQRSLFEKQTSGAKPVRAKKGR